MNNKLEPRMLRYFFEYEDAEYHIIKSDVVKAASLRQAEKKVVDDYGLAPDSFQIQLVH